KAFSTASYDRANRRVTLTLAPFMQTEFKRMAVRVNGRSASGARPKGVSDVTGNLLDGDRNGRFGGDAVQFFKVFSGTTLNFRDRDGDRVTLELSGPGQVD